MKVNTLERHLREFRSKCPNVTSVRLIITKKDETVVWVGAFDLHDESTLLKSGKFNAALRRDVGRFNGDAYSFNVEVIK